MSSSTKRIRVLVVHTHPVQYLAPLFRRYNASDQIELTVAYWRALANGQYDSGFGQHVEWNLPLLEGYRSVALSDGAGALGGAVALHRCVRRGGFDLVVSYGYRSAPALLSLGIAKLSGVRWVFVGDNHKLESPTGRGRPGKRTVLRLLTKVADGIFAQSARSSAFYESLAPRKVWMVPHAVDDERFAEARSPRRGLHPRPTVFLFAGKLIPLKRVCDAIAAVRLVPDAFLRIVGTGPDEARLREMVTPSDNVEFVGFVNQREMPGVMAAADVLVLPSSNETFGLVVSEAASVCVPAIVSDACGAVDSVVMDGSTGLVFPAGDVAALAVAMRRMTDTGFRSQLVRQLTSHFAGWTAERNAAEFVRACAAVCNSRATDVASRAHK